MNETIKGIYISIVDIIGIFIPGFIFILGLFSLAYQSSPEFFSYFTYDNKTIIELFTQPLSLFLVFVFSYVLGFLVRLSSIGLLQIITQSKWKTQLKESSEKIEELLLKLIGDDIKASLFEIEEKSKKLELMHTAPLFQLARRIIRYNSPALWSDTERLEAEMRFLAGLFVPLFLALVDFSILLFNTNFNFISIILFMINAASLGIILYVFPLRRIREVIYVYFSAIVVLKKVNL